MNMNLEQYEALRPMAEIVIDDKDTLRFSTPNKTAFWRVETLFSKEPATITWLERLKPGMVLLDVGANVGMYSIFGAKKQRAIVYAFEPESQNFALLTKNIVLNGLEQSVKAYPVALSDKIGLDQLYLSAFNWDGGGSCHSFGDEVGFNLEARSAPLAQGCAAWTIDEAVRCGAIDVPDFIKVDVDGFEYKVIKGAENTLKNVKVRSLCIEINTNLVAHRQLVDYLQSLGFYFDPRQVELATRAEGAFKGCAEYVFDRMPRSKIHIETGFSSKVRTSSISPEHKSASEYVYRKIEQCTVTNDPFPHIVIDAIFPDEYYKRMLEMFPSESELTPLSETGRVTGYSAKTRLVTLFNDEHFDRMASTRREFWSEFGSWMYSEEFVELVTKKFLPWCANRLSGLHERFGSLNLRSDALLVSDKTNYAIGPHTDAAHRLISFLFYMPQDFRIQGLGTSLYRHKDPSFFCPGGPHYEFKDFENLTTVGFIPNRLLAFVRTGRSFHGVEPIVHLEADRRLLINNVRITSSSPIAAPKTYVTHGNRS